MSRDLQAGLGIVMHAAMQQPQGTMAPDRSHFRPPHPPRAHHVAALPPMSIAKPREFFIQGVTQDGRAFRPSDWSERLAGAMSCFRPGGGIGGIGAYIGYSPYCVPQVIDGVKCVIVSEALKDLEPMAWDFVMNFARDNDLQVAEACLLPDRPPARGG
jgi:hypothetical protein